jgi:N-acetylneuraminic acid mutarotase
MNIKENKWTELPDLNTGRYYHSSCSFNESKVFVFCGIEHMTKKYLDTIEFLNLSEKELGWQKFEVNYGEKVTWPLISGRQGLGTCQYDNDSVMLIGGYTQGVFSDESFIIDVETRTFRSKATLPIEAFPFAMPTVSDISNKIVYTVDWSKFKVMKFHEDKWS